jgi:uncharacterized protein YndB with AHSA1/START domain
MSEETKFVYVTYIRTTPEKLWEALTKPEFMKQYFFGTTMESTWEKGSPWKMISGDGTLYDAGEVVENDPPRRRVLRWRNEWKPELNAEGYGTCVMDIEPDEKMKMVKLTITHTMPVKESKTIAAVSGGWPKIISQLKTLLETGNAVGSTK